VNAKNAELKGLPTKKTKMFLSVFGPQDDPGLAEALASHSVTFLNASDIPDLRRARFAIAPPQRSLRLLLSSTPKYAY
jgi:hypothetical protein